MILQKANFVFALMAVVFILQTEQLHAQDGDSYRRVSFSFNAGTVNAANSGSSFSPLGSFGRPLSSGFSLGSGLMYSFTPAFALEGRGHLQFFNLSNPEVVDQVAHGSLRGVVFLNQLFGFQLLNSRVAPYFTAGTGLDVVQITDFSQSGWNVVAGLGTSIYLTESLDFFAQYDWSGGNKLNTSRQSAGNFSSYRNVYAGLRIHFGPDGTTHPSWRQPLLRREEPTRIMAEESTQQQEEENSMLVSELREENEELTALIQRLEGQNQLLESEINALRERIAEMELMVGSDETRSQPPQSEAIYNEITPGSENPTASSADAGEADARTIQIQTDGIYPANGHYVQLYASRAIRPASRVRAMAIEQLNGQFENAADMVFIARRQQFYEVFVGMFSRFSQANTVVQGFHSDFNDAFVITFPRPAHLSAQYEDVEVINAENRGTLSTEN